MPATRTMARMESLLERTEAQDPIKPELDPSHPTVTP